MIYEKLLFVLMFLFFSCSKNLENKKQSSKPVDSKIKEEKKPMFILG